MSIKHSSAISQGLHVGLCRKHRGESQWILLCTLMNVYVAHIFCASPSYGPYGHIWKRPYPQETRRRKCYLSSGEQIWSQRDEEGIVKTVQTVVTKWTLVSSSEPRMPSNPTTRPYISSSLRVEGHILLPFSPPSNILDLGSVFILQGTFIFP